MHVLSAVSYKAQSKVLRAAKCNLQWLGTVAAAARAYLFESAELFAAQLWHFIASGLSLEAHDRAVFGLDETAATPAAPPVPVSGRLAVWSCVQSDLAILIGDHSRLTSYGFRFKNKAYAAHACCCRWRS